MQNLLISAELANKLKDYILQSKSNKYTTLESLNIIKELDKLPTAIVKEEKQES
jgi:hypothetical protein